MVNDPNENNVPDEPRISEREWYRLAITFLCFSVVFFVFAFVWVFYSGDVAAMKDRAQAITPFGAAFFAFVTFCTVAWRGIQTDRQLHYQDKQLRYQGEQLHQIARQNDAKDEENRVKVLQEGAKLIAEKKKTSQALAGISSLDYLVRKGASPFAEQAADLLSAFLMDTYGKSDLNRVSRAIIAALQRCEDTNIMPDIEGVFTGPQKEVDRLRLWSYIPAIQNITLIGGSLDAVTFDRMRNRIKLLRNVIIHRANIGCPDKTFTNCKFHNCRINSVNFGDLLANEFYGCDFSDAFIEIDATTNNEVFVDHFDLRKNNNFYKSGRPPRSLDGNSMAQWLLSEQELRIREGKDPDD